MTKMQFASVLCVVLVSSSVCQAQQAIETPNSPQYIPQSFTRAASGQIGDSPTFGQLEPPAPAIDPLFTADTFTADAWNSQPAEPVAPSVAVPESTGAVARTGFVVPRRDQNIVGANFAAANNVTGCRCDGGSACNSGCGAAPMGAACGCSSMIGGGGTSCCGNGSCGTGACDADGCQNGMCSTAPAPRGSGLCAQNPTASNSCGCQATSRCDSGPMGCNCGACGANNGLLDVNRFSGAGYAAPGCDCGGNGWQGGGVRCGVSLATRLRNLGAMRQSSSNRIIAGGGVALVRPYWETNPAFYVGNGATPAASSIQRVVSFDWDLEVSPFVWVGFQNRNGTEFRASYWYFDADEAVSLDVGAGESVVSARPLDLSGTAGPGSEVSANQFLEFQVFDLEARRSNRLGCWSLTYGGGLRYLTIDQGYLILANDPASGPLGLASLHGFDGLGPTFHLDFERPIGRRCWSTFGSLRQSVLLGDRGSRVFGINNQAQILRDEDNKGVVSMTAIEGGVRRVSHLGQLGTFFEFAGGAQFWTGVGNAANGGAFTLQRDQAMGLVGFRVSAGLSF